MAEGLTTPSDGIPDPAAGRSPTIRPLPLGLAPGDGETPVDYLARLSFRNGRDSLRSICKDFGIGLESLMRGSRDEVDMVARLGGANPSRLHASAFRSHGDGSWTVHRGQVLGNSMSNDSRVRFCPACLRQDVENGNGRVECRPWRRGEWFVSDLFTCAIHSLELVGPDGRLVDFTMAMVDAIPRLPDLVRSAEVRPATGLERYIVSRLSAIPPGAGCGSWLDDMPLYAVIRLCEAIGNVALQGAGAPGKRRRDGTTRARQEAGFDVLAGGPPAVREFLGSLQDALGRTSGGAGPRAAFGPLYMWLAAFPRDSAYDPVRHAIRDHWLNTRAVGPEDADPPFGWPIMARRRHSILSASREFGIHRVPLRKILVAHGILGADQAGATDDTATFDASAHQSFLRDLASPLTRKAAAVHLGMTVTAFQGLLDAGLVVPWVGDDAALIKSRFRKADLDGFIASLLAEADPSRTDDPYLCDIATAARHSCRSQAAVVALLLSRGLKRVGRRSGAGGYGSVLVDPAEVLEASASTARVGLSAPEAAAATGINPHVLRLLVSEGLIRSRPARNPINAARQVLLDADDLARFLGRYAALSMLASERGVSSKMLKNRLAAAGIGPAAFSDAVGAVFYAKSDLPDLGGLGLASRPGTRLVRRLRRDGDG